MGFFLPPNLRARCLSGMPPGDATRPTKAVRAKAGTGAASMTKRRRLLAAVAVRVEGDTLVLPIRVTTESNTGGNRAKIGRRRTQRLVTLAGLREMERTQGALPTFPARVTFVRVRPKGRRPLDDDNLVGSFKAVRDEIAAFYGVDDGDPRWQWRYAPAEIVADDYAVRVTIEAVTDGGFSDG